jgi:hypothetical protein
MGLKNLQKVRLPGILLGMTLESNQGGIESLKTVHNSWA